MAVAHDLAVFMNNEIDYVTSQTLLSNYCRASGAVFNQAKTNVIGLENESNLCAVSSISTFKYLGLYLDQIGFNIPALQKHLLNKMEEVV